MLGLVLFYIVCETAFAAVSFLEEEILYLHGNFLVK